MMAISLIVYCVCEEKVVNISYSQKHWRDIKQGAHNDQTFLHHVKGSSQSYTMLNGQTFLLLYLGHLIVNFPYSYFYFRPPSPASHTYPPFFWEYILPNINLVPFEIILMRVMNTWPHEYTQLIVSCAQCTPCKPSVVLSPLLTYDLCATGQNLWPLNKKCQVLLSLSDNICLSNDHIEQTQQFPLWIWIWSSTFLMELIPTSQ